MKLYKEENDLREILQKFIDYHNDCFKTGYPDDKIDEKLNEICYLIDNRTFVKNALGKEYLKRMGGDMEVVKKYE